MCVVNQLVLRRAQVSFGVGVGLCLKEPERSVRSSGHMPPPGGTGYAPARRGGDQEQRRRTGPRAPRGVVPRVGPRRRAAAELRAHRRRALEPDLPRLRRRRRPLDPAPPAARDDARLRPRHGPRAPHPQRAGGHRRARAAPDRAVRRRVGHRRRLLRHGAGRRAGAARRGRRGGGLRRGRPPRPRRGAGGHARRPARRRPRRRRARRARPPRRLRRAPAQALEAPVGGLQDARPRRDGGDPPAAVGARARAGLDLARARRLPARQRDRHAARARWPPCSTGSCARSATRSPTSAS